MNQKSMFYGASGQIFERARHLRNNLTPEESQLWGHLRKKQLGVRFKAQHPIDTYIADFYCHQAKLVIEIDGASHRRQKEYDIGRTEELEAYGIQVLRFSNEEVSIDITKVLQVIREEVNKRLAADTTPNP
jgi:very-short-patch-repair endonuclease